MRKLDNQYKRPEDFISDDDIESAPHDQASQYTVESMKKHHDEVVYYKQRKGGEDWFHGRVSNKYRENYDQIKWEKD
jgi:hypothetical protein